MGVNELVHLVALFDQPVQNDLHFGDLLSEACRLFACALDEIADALAFAVRGNDIGMQNVRERGFH
jgi:hypothetical protein